MNQKDFFVGVFAAACLVTSTLLVPSVGHAQADPRVTKSMETLKAMTAKLGTPKLDGTEAVGGKEAPALYFGTTKVNNAFDIVDAVGIQDGQGMTATLFAKGGDEYILPRVCRSRTAVAERLVPFWRALLTCRASSHRTCRCKEWRP